MNTILSTLFHLFVAALLFLLWKMWEEPVTALLIGLRKAILGRRKVKVEVGESKDSKEDKA